MKRAIWAIVLGLGAIVVMGGGTAHAQSRVVVTADLTSIWHGYAVYLDGQQADGQASNQPKTFADVYPGRHEISVEIWEGLTKHHVACKGLVNVPQNAEIRVKCGGNGKLAVFGGTQLESREDQDRDATREKRKRMRQALRDLIDDASDEPHECRRAVVKPAQAIMDRIDARRPDWRSVLRKLRNAADDAQEVCPRSIVRGFSVVREVAEDLADGER
jgi:hypothetical protein